MRAATLESHDLYEGVGAHEFNHRWDNADDVECTSEIDLREVPTPALFAAQSLLATVHIRLDGIDVSHYQETIDWEVVHHIPTFWAATKLTQSTGYLDPTGQGRRQAAASAGFRHRGMYHWVSSSTDVDKQAAWFLKNVGNLLINEFAMLDAEEAGVTAERTLELAEAIEAVVRRPIAVYSGAYVDSGRIWRSGAIREGKFGPRPMILAAYTNEAHAKQVCDFGNYPWSSWQFSSSGPVDGVLSHTGTPDRVDMNRVDDIAIYDRACGLIASPPTPSLPEPETPPAPAPDPTPTPSGPPPDPALLGGDDMGFIAANSDAQQPGHEDTAGERFYVNGVAKRHLRDGDEVERYKKHGLLPADFNLADNSDPNLAWLTTAELDTYPTV